MGRESKASQTNTFTGGMNLDLDNSIIGANQYRYAKNVRTIAGSDGTTGSLTNVEGPLLVNSNWMKHGEVILTSGSIRDIGFVITEVPTDESKVNYIYRIDFASKASPVFTNILGTGGLNFGIPNDTHISTVARYEDHDNVKLYWADGVNYVRSINIASTHDEANRLVTTPEYFNITPNAVLEPPKIESIGSGRLNSGMIQYAYQLINSAGSETDISLMSKQIAITPSDIDTISTKYKGGRIDEIDGTPAGKSVKVSISISESDFKRVKLYSIYYANSGDEPIINVVANTKISGNRAVIVDSGSSYIGEITLEEFNALSPIRRIPGVMEAHDNILFIGAPKEHTFDLDDYDTRAFSFDANDYLVLHDENTGVVELERADLGHPDFHLHLPLDHDCIVPEKYSKEHYHDLEYIYRDGPNGILGGEGLNVSYMFTNTYLIESMGQYLQKVVNPSLPSSGNEMANAYIDRRIPRIGSEKKQLDHIYIRRADSTYDQIPLSSMGISNHVGHLDYSNPLLSGVLRSYKRDEIYRFAAVFHSRDGRRSPAKWVADIRFPAGYVTKGNDGENRYECNIADNPEQSEGYLSGIVNSIKKEELVVKPMGLSFEFKNIPADVAKIEIVRSKRDINNRTVYMQGLVKKIGTHRGNQEFGETSVVKLINEGLVNSFRPHPIIGMGDEYAIGGLSFFAPTYLSNPAVNETFGFTDNYPSFTPIPYGLFGTGRAILPHPGSAFPDSEALNDTAQRSSILTKAGINLSPLFASRHSFFLINTESAFYGEDYLLSIKKAIINPTISVQDIVWPMSTPALSILNLRPLPSGLTLKNYFGSEYHSSMQLKMPGDSDFVPTTMYFGADITPAQYHREKLADIYDNHFFSYGLVGLSAHYLKQDNNGLNNRYRTPASIGIPFTGGDVDASGGHKASMDLVYIILGGLATFANPDGFSVAEVSYRNGIYKTGTSRSVVEGNSYSATFRDHPNAFVDQTQIEGMNSVTFKYYDRMYTRRDSQYYFGGEYYNQYSPRIVSIKRNSSLYTDYTLLENAGSGQQGEAHKELEWFCREVNGMNMKVSDMSESKSVAPGIPIERAIEYSQIGGKPYLNWAKPLVRGDNANEDHRFLSNVVSKTKAAGPHGEGVLIEIGENKTFPLIKSIDSPVRFGPMEDEENVSRYARIRAAGRATLASYLVDIKSMNSGIYGGNTYNSRQLSEYIPTGFYIDAQSGTGEGVVFGGDTYINILDYVAVRASDPYVEAVTEEQLTTKSRASIVLSQVKQIGAMIPMESSINTRMQSGETYCQSDYNPAIQKNPGAYMTAGNNGAKWTSSQRQPEFDYNAAYSSEQVAIGYTSLLDIDEVNKDFDSRVYSSEVKTNDEIIDSWSKFKPANYLDLDSRYGKLTRLNSFKNKLIFWQENAMGVLSVNDRALITDLEGGALALGTAGILTRFDYISTNSGISKRMVSGLVAGNNSLYWYDHDRADLSSISDGVTSVSKTKGIQSLLNANKDRIKNKIPVAYDSKYNEVIVGIPGIMHSLNGGYLLHSQDGIIIIDNNNAISI